MAFLFGLRKRDIELFSLEETAEPGYHDFEDTKKELISRTSAS